MPLILNVKKESKLAQPFGKGTIRAQSLTANTQDDLLTRTPVGRHYNMSDAPEDVTGLLIQWSEGNRGHLTPDAAVYDELHRIAGAISAANALVTPSSRLRSSTRLIFAWSARAM